MSAVLAGIAEILRFTLGAAIEVRLHVADGLPPAMADRGQLEAVLVNLATNARDAMPRGGVLTIGARMEILDAEEAQRRGLPAPGDYLRIEVADTGIGMDAETLARATEPFFTTKGPGVGTGLGLPMAHGFAKQSGGQLSVASSPGNGATVTLWLPRASSDAKPSPSATLPKDMHGGAAATVLLVDDEETVRDVLAAQLEDAGYRVVKASRGADAINILDGDAVLEALVTDLTMPGVDGLAVLQAAARRRPPVASILLTGYVGDAAQLASGQQFHGAFSLMRKPVSGPELVHRLRALARSPNGG